ncbi:membrane transport protein [Salmonella enterica subsp. enterica]|uniref:Membrane transport protein n=1 Tax=Salmonella enterica I TaxID=59201 RepID=A0A447PFH3_SALET|nr:membrane transport protein [Salmonella enterica subsp. enterica]
MSPSDVPINWKRNLTVYLAGLFFNRRGIQPGHAFSPLYVEQLGVTGHSALNMWSGLVFSITFLFSAIASPFWAVWRIVKGVRLCCCVPLSAWPL